MYFSARSSVSATDDFKLGATRGQSVELYKYSSVSNRQPPVYLLEENFPPPPVAY